MSYLVAYVNGEKFTPEVREYKTWEGGESYILLSTHSETVRLAEYFDIRVREFEYPEDSYICVTVDQEERQGFFGRKTVVSTYTFRCNRFTQEFQSDLVYLEE